MDMNDELAMDIVKTALPMFGGELKMAIEHILTRMGQSIPRKPSRVRVIDENRQLFNDRIYHRNKKDYYVSNGKMLHVAVWEYYNGKVPANYDVHHKRQNADGSWNKHKNNIEDLRLIEHVEHSILHNRYTNKYKKLYKRICKWCGREFETLQPCQIYCKNECRRAATYSKRTYEERTCVVCGKKFMVRIDSKTECCSIKCGKRKKNILV